MFVFVCALVLVCECESVGVGGLIGSDTLASAHNTNSTYKHTRIFTHNLQAVQTGSSEQLMPGLIFNRKKAITYQDPLQGTTTQVICVCVHMLSLPLTAACQLPK